MGVLLRDALRRLCVEIGWSYAAFWRAIGFRNPMHLVWEDGHCERLPNISGFDAMDTLLKEKRAARIAGNDRITEIACRAEDRLGWLVRKTMAEQVHVVGDGAIGQAALMGSHRWILRDMLDGSASNVLAEMSPQFLAGIQTIVIIPVLPFGVVQLGSTKMVIENIGFINHVRSLFSQLGSIPGALLAEANQKALSKNGQVCSSSTIPASNVLSGDSCVQTIRPLPDVSHDLEDRRLATRSVTQPYSLPFKHISGKSEYRLSKFPLTNMTPASTRMTHCDKFQQIVDPMVKPSNLNNELETNPLEAQMPLSKPGVTLTQPVLAYKSLSGLGNGSSFVTSGLCSNSLIIPEKQLDSLSSSGSLENKPTVKNSESFQVRSSRRESCDPLMDTVVSLFGRKGPIADENAFGTTGTFPLETKEGIMTSHVAPCGSKTSQVLNKVKDSKGLQVILGPSTSMGPSGKDSRNLATSGKQNQGNDLFEAVEVLHTEFGKSDSCYDSLFGALLDCWPSLDACEEKQRFSNAGIDTETVLNSREKIREEPGFLDTLDAKSLQSLKQPCSGNDLFDALGGEYKLTHYPSSSDVAVHNGQVSAPELDIDASTCTTQLDSSCFYDSLNYENHYGNIFVEDCHDQLLGAVVSKAKSCAKQKSDDGISCKTSVTHTSGTSSQPSSSASGWVASSEQTQNNIVGHSSVLLKTQAAVSNPAKSACSTDKTADCSIGYGSYKSQISPWVESSHGGNRDSGSVAHCKQADDIVKCTRKRSRPGENPRPRPKDRQMIQDRVKELREIVPNGAKCSIDALLEKTIKHMLFLQSVTKHADKLKEAGEPKIVSKEGGLLLKDNFEGGATWAFEVGTQSMICPIIVEDLHPPRQMHVEMLCEERGFFLEIADMIRGLGLTILKGVMETRDDKIWARFAVEANRDVTRMEVFLSLVRLLEPIMGNRMAPMGSDNIAMPQALVQQASIPATGPSKCLG